MTKQDAYKIVYNDILNRDIGLFLGRFDAKNGKSEFMYGIATLMDFIAYESSEADYDDFQEIWFENFQKSIDKAKEIWYTLVTIKKGDKNYENLKVWKDFSVAEWGRHLDKVWTNSWRFGKKVRKSGHIKFSCSNSKFT